MCYCVVTWLSCRCVELCRQLDELKLETKSMDRQLLDAVTQKLQLSQQLEAWQVSHSVFH